MGWKQIENQDRRFGSALSYWHTRGPDCEPLLFTEDEVRVARERARANPEDLSALEAQANLFERAPDGP